MRSLLFILLPLFCTVPLAGGADDTTPLVTFLQFIATTRTANQASANAKAKALALFSTLYCQGEEATRLILAELVPAITAITNKKHLSAGRKDHLMLILIEQKRLEIEQSLPKGSILIPKAAKLLRAVYATLNPTFGDFWRTVRIAVGSAIGGAGFIVLAYFFYRALHTEKSIANTAYEALSLAKRVEQNLVTPGTAPHTMAQAAATLASALQAEGSLPHQLATNAAALTAPQGPVDSLVKTLNAIQEKDPMLLAELLCAVTTMIQKGNEHEGDGPFRQMATLLSNVQEQNEAALTELITAVTAKMHRSLTAQEVAETKSAFETLIHLLNEVHGADREALVKLITAVTPLLTRPDGPQAAEAQGGIIAAAQGLTAQAAVTSVNTLAWALKKITGK